MDEAKRKAIEKAVSDNNGELPSWAAAIRSGEHTITRDEFYQVKAEMQNKPSWSDAPDWAEWLGQNANGFWTWYEDEPHKVEPEKGFFVGHFKSRSHSARKLPANSRGGVIGDWSNTLEERPSAHTGTNVKISIVSGDDDIDIQPTFFADMFEVFNPATGFKFGIDANGECYTESLGEKHSKEPTSNWHERGDSPPVGEVVEYHEVGEKWVKCTVLAVDEESLWLKSQTGRLVTSLGYVRPLRTKYDKLVAAAESAIEIETGEPANSRHIGVLVKLGWRPPKN